MLPKELIKRIRRLEITTRKVVSALLAGAYHSVFKGRGMAFSEVRQYYPGDEVRTIDWNVTARMNDPYVKVFTEERELTVMLLVDVSASEEFGSKLRPYIGGGVGWARTHYEAAFITTFSNGSPTTGLRATTTDENSGFAWQLGLGFNYEVAQDVDVGLGYRYFVGPRIDAFYTGFTGNAPMDNENHAVQVNLTVGIN